MVNQNFARLGSQLQADYVLAIDLQNLELKEGATLYRGRCDCSIAVYKVAEGDRAVFRKQIPPLVFPTAGVPVTDMDEAKFQGMYLTMLANRVARVFHPYDASSDVAIDALAYGLDRF
jgi:hypothetical protein